MASDAQRKAVAQYDKDNTKRYTLKLNKKTDNDIIDYLEPMPNKQGTIKGCIRDKITQINLTRR